LWCVRLFFFQAEDGIRDFHVTGVQTCALPICCEFLDQGAHPGPDRTVAGRVRLAEANDADLADYAGDEHVPGDDADDDAYDAHRDLQCTHVRGLSGSETSGGFEKS